MKSHARLPLLIEVYKLHHVVVFGAHYWGDRAEALESHLPPESIYSTCYPYVNVGLEIWLLHTRPQRKPILFDRSGNATYDRHTHSPTFPHLLTEEELANVHRFPYANCDRTGGGRSPASLLGLDIV